MAPPKARRRIRGGDASDHDRRPQVRRVSTFRPDTSFVWSPTVFTAFKALLSIRLASAVWNGVSDCDETFNYWEPTHFFVYGSGFQTWEYSPAYALRSYVYVALHAFPGFCYASLIQQNPTAVFFFIRCILGFVSAACETYFYSCVMEKFGPKCGRMTLGLLLMSAGMYHASTAYLPSSFAMYMNMIAMGAWLTGVVELGIVATALSALVGWPFAAVLGIPIAIDVVFRKQDVWRFVKACLIALFFILVPMVNMDSYLYGKLVVAPWNIINYNVFGSGSQLYGKEPLSFYLLNGFLNFNVAFVASFFALPMSAVESVFRRKWKMEKHAEYPPWLTLSGFYLWIFIFFSQPHKEERFLFPIYPLICLAASMTLESVESLLEKFMEIVFVANRKNVGLLFGRLNRAIPAVFLGIFALVSVSRVIAVHKGYHGSMEVYMEMGELARHSRAVSHEKLVYHPLDMNRETTLCLGKEWYRFPSSFFLPSTKWKVGFVQSEFRGLLPKPYAYGPNATSLIPTAMNDRNQEEVSRYVDESSCDLLIDYDPPGESCGAPREPCYSRDTSTWAVVHSAKFLNAPTSSQFFRSFYVPYLSDEYCSFGKYDLLARRIAPKLRSTWNS